MLFSFGIENPMGQLHVMQRCASMSLENPMIKKEACLPNKLLFVTLLSKQSALGISLIFKNINNLLPNFFENLGLTSLK